MNRCFLKKDLADSSKTTTLEARRAKELDALLGPKGAAAPAVDLIIDLHNTTANTGVALMMPPQDSLSHAIGAHLCEHDSTVRIVNYLAGKEDYPMLPTVARHGMTFEVGAVAWGVVDAALFNQSFTLLMRTLDYIHAHNLAVAAGKAAAWRSIEVPVYEAVRTVDFPRYEDGSIAAMVHPSMQGRDFMRVTHGQPVFQRFTGESVGFDDLKGGEDEPSYLFFINEAAYYEKGIGFFVAYYQKQGVRVLSSAAVLSSDAAADGPASKRHKPDA